MVYTENRALRRLSDDGSLHIELSSMKHARNFRKKLQRNSLQSNSFRSLNSYFTEEEEVEEVSQLKKLRRRAYVFLSEPDSSIQAAVFFGCFMFLVVVSNIVMMGQTTPRWTYIPDNCFSCENEEVKHDIPCVCEPEPLPSTVLIQDICMILLTIEWLLRVSCYVPLQVNFKKSKYCCSLDEFKQWSKILYKPSTIVDGLAVFPYYFERFLTAKGLISLRLLRILRLFLIIRLGKFSSDLQALFLVIVKSVVPLNILFLGLMWGAAFFGSMLYFTEMGNWKYMSESNSYNYVRLSVDGVTEEPSPFHSILNGFWWFIVTATTTGYGDYFPTTTAGYFVGTLAIIYGLIITSVLVSLICTFWCDEILYIKKDGEDTDSNSRSIDGKADENIADLNESIDSHLLPKESEKPKSGRTLSTHIVSEKGDSVKYHFRNCSNLSLRSSLSMHPDRQKTCYVKKADVDTATKYLDAAARRRKQIIESHAQLNNIFQRLNTCPTRS